MSKVKINLTSAFQLWQGLVVLLAIIGAVYFVGNKVVKAMKAELEAQLANVQAQSQKQFDNIDGKVTVLMTDATAKDQQIADLKQALAGLVDQEKKDQQALAQIQAKIQTASPDTLVAEGRRILNTTEINFVASTNLVNFSLSAYRLDVSKLEEWEQFSLNIIPNKDAQILNLSQANSTQAAEITDLKNVIGLDNQWKGVALNTMDEYRKIAEQAINPSFWTKAWNDAKSGAWGVVLGFVLGKVIKK